MFEDVLNGLLTESVNMFEDVFSMHFTCTVDRDFGPGLHRAQKEGASNVPVCLFPAGFG